MPGVRKTIAVLPGDGIGPEVIRAAIQLIQDCAAAFGHDFEFRDYPFGGNAIDSHGVHCHRKCLRDAERPTRFCWALSARPKWKSLPFGTRPEAGLLGIGEELGLYINLRPIRLRPALRAISPLRPERLGDCDFEDAARSLPATSISASTKSRRKSQRSGGIFRSGNRVARVARYAFDRRPRRTSI